MAGHMTTNTETLIRTDVWERQLKQLLWDDLMAMRWVRILTDFPDGTTLHIPSIGKAETQAFVEGQAVKYNKLDEGDYEFEFDQYRYSAHSVTEKFKRDSYYSSDVISAFPRLQHRAIMEDVETRVLSRGPAAQTPNDLNLINTAPHRFIGSGTGESIMPADFARARYSLRKASVPARNLVAIVDPSVAFTLATQANIVNMLSPMPSAETTLREGLVTGLQYRFSLFGFDIYESSFLQQGLAETIDGLTTTTGVANLFFSAEPGDTLPIIGGFRQMPTVYTEFNKDLQQDEFLTITEYGFQLYRPDNMVVIITDTDVV